MILKRSIDAADKSAFTFTGKRFISEHKKRYGNFNTKK